MGSMGACKRFHSRSSRPPNLSMTNKWRFCDALPIARMHRSGTSALVGTLHRMGLYAHANFFSLRTARPQSMCIRTGKLFALATDW
jgi:hypothetical protein